MAAETGAACNVNTNALALTPRAAVGMVRSGLARIHISLDTHLPEVQDSIHQRQGRWHQVVRGLHNIQIAKALLNSEHPQIHLNCVLTRKNASSFPSFLRFLLDMKPLVDGAVIGDLDMHVIPVGGEENRHLRLTAAGYVRFFTEIWERANAVWQAAERHVSCLSCFHASLNGNHSAIPSYLSRTFSSDISSLTAANLTLSSPISSPGSNHSPT